MAQAASPLKKQGAAKASVKVL